MEIPDRFSLAVERGKAGLWYITSPDIKGLMVAERQLDFALEMVPQALVALRKAAEESQ